ncbi:MAG TPA: fimbrial protein [Rhodanobacter sp.]|nr:fimbrial protein [Rhodanobacter sp.]
MTKTLLSTAFVAILGAVAFVPAAQAATATDGTITINGQVVAATCTIAVNGGTANGTVVLKPAPTTSLATAGSTYGDMPFTIGVTGCDASLNGKTVSPYWSGTNVNSNGRLNNTGTATLVNLQLLNNDDSTAIALNGPEGGQGTTGAAVASGAATMTYYARYYATGAAGAGTVSSTVNYTLIYQ